MRRESGDTLVEVLIATAILASAVVAGLGIMNFGFGIVMNSIERTQVQAELTSQVSMARYARDAYVAAGMTGAGGGAAAVWENLSATAGTSASAAVCNASGQTSPATGSFYLAAHGVDGVTRMPVSSTPTTPSGAATVGDGLWVEAVSVSPSSGVKYIDVYVKACWPPATGSTIQEAKTVVRLYDPTP